MRTQRGKQLDLDDADSALSNTRNAAFQTNIMRGKGVHDVGNRCRKRSIIVAREAPFLDKTSGTGKYPGTKSVRSCFRDCVSATCTTSLNLRHLQIVDTRLGFLGRRIVVPYTSFHKDIMLNASKIPSVCYWFPKSIIKSVAAFSRFNGN